MKGNVKEGVIENILLKKSGLDEGGMIMGDKGIEGGGCIVGVCEELNMGKELGLRDGGGMGVCCG